jgi:hypothetical protein
MKMTQSALEQAIARGDGLLKIAREAGCSKTTVRYWARKWGVRFSSLPFYQRNPLARRCACGETDPSKFYGHKKQICGPCHSAYVLKQGQLKRDRIVQFLGGQCKACGYKKRQCALDVHHLDPSRKDPSFGSSRGWTWARIEKELQNCVLLCKNCHAEHHAGFDVCFGM